MAEHGRGPASRLHIRPGMDVYTTRQDSYIGSVLHVHHTGTSGPSGGGETGSEGPAANVPLVHEEQNVESSSENKGQRMLGEEKGPVPTIALGNTGPERQSEAGAYATGREDALADVDWFAVRPGRLNLGFLTPPLYIPVTAVRSMAMDRVVLDVERGRIPAEWRQRP